MQTSTGPGVEKDVITFCDFGPIFHFMLHFVTMIIVYRFYLFSASLPMYV